MKLYWDRLDKQWFQSITTRALSYGGDKKLLPFKNANSSSRYLPFELCVKDNHFGPLVGILCGRKTSNQEVTGNGLLFRKLQVELLASGGLSFIFTPDDVQEQFITGHLFLPSRNSWIQMEFPFPDVVYNRMPFRKPEHSLACDKLFLILKKKKIPYFNPSFIDKYDMYTLFRSKNTIRPHLPETILLSKADSLASFLTKYRTVYLKPCLSSKGKGIYRITLNNGGRISVLGLKESFSFISFPMFWEWCANCLQDKAYIVQKAIPFAIHDGNRFDFRILSHFNHGKYAVTGIGIRLSQTQDITTHLPNGGTYISYDLVRTNEHDQFIEKIVPEIGEALSDHNGFFGEFSIDAGLSNEGNYYIYEVNSKPMSFDEEHIEAEKILRLCSLFFSLGGQSSY